MRLEIAPNTQSQIAAAAETIDDVKKRFDAWLHAEKGLEGTALQMLLLVVVETLILLAPGTGQLTDDLRVAFRQIESAVGNLKPR
jgi:hypothetical protein